MAVDMVVAEDKPAVGIDVGSEFEAVVCLDALAHGSGRLDEANRQGLSFQCSPF